MSIRRHILACIAACAATLLVIPAGSSQAALPAGFAGIVSPDVFGGSAHYQRKQLARQKAVGFTLQRQTFDWKAIEPRKGHFSWVLTDRFVLAAARANMSVMPILFGEPKWATSRTRRQRRDHPVFPPKKPKLLAAFAKVVAKRYGPGGKLWAAHPKLTPRPTTSYQVWNEPNLPVYWGGHTSARAYARLQVAVAKALRSVQPQAEVLSAGLPQSKQGVELLRYLRKLYAAGAGPAIDTLTVNLYSPSVSLLVSRLRKLRAFLHAHSPKTKLWLTEIGWSDNGPRKGYRVSTPKMTKLVTGTYRTLAGKRRSLGLRGVVYFDWRDAKPYPGGKDFWGLHTGLNRRNGKAKPVIKALRRLLVSLN